MRDRRWGLNGHTVAVVIQLEGRWTHRRRRRGGTLEHRTLRYFHWVASVLVTLVELASVYFTGLPGFDLKSTGNKHIDRGYNEEKKDGGYGLTRTLSLSFTNAPQLL